MIETHGDSDATERRSMTLPSLRPTVRRLSPHRGTPGSRALPARSGRRPAGGWLATCFAVLAVLAQVVLFEHAMAARDSAAAAERAAAPAVASQLSHGGDHCPPAGDPPAPSHHQHGADCPFCLARGAHQASALPTAAELPPRTAVAAAVPFPPPQSLAPTRGGAAGFRARAPPVTPPSPITLRPDPRPAPA